MGSWLVIKLVIICSSCKMWIRHQVWIKTHQQHFYKLNKNLKVNQTAHWNSFTGTYFHWEPWGGKGHNRRCQKREFSMVALCERLVGQVPPHSGCAYAPHQSAANSCREHHWWQTCSDCSYSRRYLTKKRMHVWYVANVKNRSVPRWCPRRPATQHGTNW